MLSYWEDDDDDDYYDDEEEESVLDYILSLLSKEKQKRPTKGSKAYKARAKKIKLLGHFEKNVGKLLGVGADGEVYEYGKDRVIKFSNTYAQRKMWDKMRKIFYKIKKHRPLNVARVYEYGRIDKNTYYVVMERLSEIKGKGMGVLRTCMYGERYPRVVKPGPYRSAYLFGVRVERLEKRLNLVHGDLHLGNVLSNKSGVWKFVDLEGFTYGE